VTAPGNERGERAGIGLQWLSLNQATVKHLSLDEAVALCVRHDIPAIGLWRDRVAEAGLAEAAAAVRAAGLKVCVAAAGYDGYVEVEIFNAEVWDAPPDQTAAMVRERFAAVLSGR
jgi:hypothetical protein